MSTQNSLYSRNRRKPDAVVIAISADDKRMPTTLDKAVASQVNAALKQAGKAGDANTITPLYTTDGPIYLVGVGDGKTASVGTLRSGFSQLARTLAGSGLKRIAITLTGRVDASADPAAIGHAIGEGLGLGSFAFDDHKGAATNGDKKASSSKLAVQLDAAMRDGFKIGLQYAESANVARHFAATPPNVAHPTWLVKQCKAMAKKVGLKCTVIDARR